MNSTATRYAFLAGVVYFAAMAVAHFFGIKVPVLFVYYDTPFYAYQDKIIAFAVVAYMGLFCAASKYRDVALTAIIVGAVTVLGLSSVNLSDALASVMAEGQTTTPYWLQTGMLGLYELVLIVLYVRDGRAVKNS